MGKKKSAVIIAFMAALIVVLCFFCVVSFPQADGIGFFNSAVSMTAKDATLGGTLVDGTNYYGGGYTAVYYPEGVISSKQYEDDLAAYTDDDARQEYVDRYVKSGSVYLDKEAEIGEDKISVCDEEGNVTEEFGEAFETALASIKARCEAFASDGVRVDLQDGYTVRIFLPQSFIDQGAGDVMTSNGSIFADVFTSLSAMGEFTVSYGTSSDGTGAAQLLPETNVRGAVIGDYIGGVSTRTGVDGTDYVVISFKGDARTIVADATADAESTSGYLFFNVGTTSAVSLTVSTPIDQDTLYISGGSLSGRSADVRAIVLSDALTGATTDLTFTIGDYTMNEALFGDSALLLVYIAFAVCFVGMMLFFFIRYGLLGFAHLFSYLLFLFPMLLCIWAIPFLYIGVGTVIALLLASVLLSVTNAVSFEYARKEYALGKTIASSVKLGYKKCFWHLFDLHIVAALLSFVVYGIALTNLSVFAFVLGLGTVFSGICSLGIGRLAWATMMSFTSRKGDFCRFKRSEVEEDD